MELSRLPASAGKVAILEALIEAGAVVVEDIFDRSMVKRCWDELAGKREGHGPGPTIPGEENEIFWGRNTIRFASLAQHSDAFIEIMLNPLVKEVADSFLE